MLLTPFERMVAMRYLRARRSDNFIGVIVAFAVIGIMLGVMTLVVVTSVMNGVRGEMLKHFVGLSGHIHVYSANAPYIEDTEQLSQKIAQITGIKRMVPVIDGQVMVTGNSVARGAQVKAYDFRNVKDDGYLAEKVRDEGWQEYKAAQGLLVGSALADELRGANDLMLISPDGRRTVVGLVPRMKTYPIVGEFTFGMQSIDANLVLMPFEAAQRYFKLPLNLEIDGDEAIESTSYSASSLEITLDSLDDTARVAAELKEILGTEYRVFDWQQTNGAVFEALNVQRTVMFLILMMIVLVAAFNIIASLVMLVKDKQRDIAVMRAFGVSARSIQRIFVAIGMGIGLFATISGTLVGILIALNADGFRQWFEQTTGQQLLGGNLYFLSTLPAEVDMFEVLMVVLLALGLSFLATLYPARRAANLQPAEALRYE